MKRLIPLLLIAVLWLGGCAGSAPVTLGDYKGLTLTMDKAVVTDYDLTLASNKKLLANGYAETENGIKLTEGTVQIGDTVQLTYDGTVDGKAFEGGNGTGYYVIGDGRLIPGFEQGLIGAQLGKETTLELTFPRAYSDDALAGKEVTFKVTVQTIIARIRYAPLTEEIARSLGFESLEDYRQNLYNEVQTALTEKAEQEKTALLWAQVLKNSTFEEELPEELLETATNDWTRRYTAAANQLGYDTIAEYLTANSLGDYDTLLEQETRATVHNLLAARAIAEAEGFELTDAVLEEKGAAYAKEAGYPSAEKYINDLGESMLEYQILLDYAQGVVVENAIIK